MFHFEIAFFELFRIELVDKDSENFCDYVLPLCSDLRSSALTFTTPKAYFRTRLFLFFNEFV